MHGAFDLSALLAFWVFALSLLVCGFLAIGWFCWCLLLVMIVVGLLIINYYSSLFFFHFYYFVIVRVAGVLSWVGLVVWVCGPLGLRLGV